MIDCDQWPLKTVAVSVGATSGYQTVVAANSYIAPCIVGYDLCARTAVDVQFCGTAGTTGVSYSGAIPLGDKGRLSMPVTGRPHIQMAPGHGIILNLSGANEVSGYISYVLLDQRAKP
jgi:hypothetical protein